ncbi:hypothetical protein PVK06_011871 [Gossypium arboreum]|uniref:Reverse transcriptase zinc-binding domain-containing protein n=1 Tax=Gossypium arboreum TaxID=29729 RepID=A0ABR0QAR3_GOSAR|nr:hypothetical protein PVK06_011871 [Gossypium arboreum]
MWERICELPIIPNGSTGRVIWFHNKDGSYIMKSAYLWLILKKRLGHDFLLTNVKISSINQSFGRGCLKCDGGEETALHALKECTKALTILALGGLEGRLLDSIHERCIDWLEEAMRLLDKKAFEDLSTIIWNIWNIWNIHNNAIFWCKNEYARAIWEQTKMLRDDFWIHNLTNKQMMPMSSRL